MTFREVVLRAKQFVTFSVSVKHKKDKFISAYIYTYSFTKARKKMCIHTLSIVCCFSIVFLLQQKETGTNTVAVYIFNRAPV